VPADAQRERMAADERVAAVVVAYNGGEELAACVRSLLAQTLPELEVIVVDNASTDGSVQRLEAAIGRDVRVVRRAINGGYGAGANTGWRATDAPIVAILNQDLTFESDCLERMRQALVDEPRDALVSPKLVLQSDPSRVNAIGNDVHLSGVTWCHGLGTLAADWHGIQEVTTISGAAFMARRPFLEQLGGLEEAYFMYMEDVDLSFRSRLTGATCLAACDAVAVHDWSLDLTPQKFGLLERNRRCLWTRFFGASGGPGLVFLQAEAMGWVYAVLRGRAYVTAKWAAHRGQLALVPAYAESQAIRPWLSRRHPYELLFPRSKLIAVAGGLIDALVERSVRFRPGVRRTAP
jgi:GT2 family glycosyltransferase